MTDLSPLGIQYKTLDELRAQYITQLTNVNPNFTALPGSVQSLIADESSVGSYQYQQGLAAVLSSLSQTYAPTEIVKLIGESVGLQQATDVQAAVDLVFSGAAGIIIPEGTICASADGTVIVRTLSGGAIASSGDVTLSAMVTTGNTATPVAAGTVTVITPAIPGVTVSQPDAGIAALPAETDQQYTQRVRAAMRCNRLGIRDVALTLIKSVSGVSPRLVAVRQQPAIQTTVTTEVTASETVTLPTMTEITFGSTTMRTTQSVSANDMVSAIVDCWCDGQATVAANATGTLATAIAGVTDITAISDSVTTTNLGLTYIVGGGDDYAVAAAIMMAGFGLYTAVPSTFNNSGAVSVSMRDGGDTVTVGFVRPYQASLTVLCHVTLSGSVNYQAWVGIAQTSIIGYFSGLTVGAAINIEDIKYTIKSDMSSSGQSWTAVEYLALTITAGGITLCNTASTGTISASATTYGYDAYFAPSATDITFVQV